MAWSAWEIPLGILTGGISSAFHAGVDGTQAIGNNIGNFIGSAYAQQSNSDKASLNQQLADDRAWQEYMSNTSVQRAVKDIQAAGLNPWLAVQGGSALTASNGSANGSSALASVLGSNLSSQSKITTKLLDVLQNSFTTALKTILNAVK